MISGVQSICRWPAGNGTTCRRIYKEHGCHEGTECEGILFDACVTKTVNPQCQADTKVNQAVAGIVEDRGPHRMRMLDNRIDLKERDLKGNTHGIRYERKKDVHLHSDLSECASCHPSMGLFWFEKPLIGKS